jgi:hypothetical protein
MKRRNLLLGLGAAVSGGAATMGTGAFSSAQADRSVSVSVASDNPGAYLALDETDDSTQASENRGEFTDLPNGGAAQISNGKLSIDLNGFAGVTGGGLGPATDATTDVDGVFEVINQSNQDPLFVNISSVSFDSSGDGTDDTTLTFYPGESSNTDLSDGSAELELPTGQSTPIGIRIVTQDSTGGNNPVSADATVTATASSNDSTTLVDDTTDFEDPEPS